MERLVVMVGRVAEKADVRFAVWSLVSQFGLVWIGWKVG